MWMRNCLAVIMLATAAGMASAAKPRIEYTVTRIQPQNGFAAHITNAGVIAGNAVFNGSTVHGFITRNGVATQITGLGGSSQPIEVRDINERAQVVGRYYLRGDATGFRNRGFVYQNGEMQDVNVFLPAESWATGIDNAGRIVGAYWYLGGPPRGYLRFADGSFRDIGALPFATPFTSPMAINGRGQVVGGSGPWTGGPLENRPFLYQDGTMRNLGHLGGELGLADDINERGQVTGSSSLGAPGVEHAFLWQNGRMIDIDGRQGVGRSHGYSINEHGHVVGASDHLGPFVWRGKKMESLTALIDPAGGYRMTSAWDINDKGQIVGTAEQAGAEFQVRLDPVRCPTTAQPGAAPDAMPGR